MTVFLTLVTAAVTGWVIDRLAFHGELTAMVRDEVVAIGYRRKLPPKAARTTRRGAGAR